MIAIKAMRDITSGHLRSSGRTEHLCLRLLGTLWFTRGRLPQVLATLQLVSISLSHFFYLLGLFGPLQPMCRHFPFGLGIIVSRFSRRPPKRRHFECLVLLRSPQDRCGTTYIICIIIAVCIYCFVITLGLRSKYDVLGHYFRFAARILANP